MSTWKEVVHALDDETLGATAREILQSSFEELSNVDAVSALLHLAPFAQTTKQKILLAESIADRMEGSLASVLVHDNVNIPALHDVASAAIGMRPDVSRAIDALDLSRLNEILEALPEESRIQYAMYLANNSKSQAFDEIVEYLKFTICHENLITFLELAAGDSHGIHLILSKQAIKYLFDSSDLNTKIELISDSIQWSILKEEYFLTVFISAYISEISTTNPSFQIWKIEPILKAGIVQETRYPLGSWMGNKSGGKLTKLGIVLKSTLETLHQNLPDKTLPHPANASDQSRENLPSPALEASYDASDLPIQSEQGKREKKKPWWSLR